MSVLVGVDVGGTFTDFVVLSNGSARAHKVPSTPDDYGRAVERGLRELGLEAGYSLVHSSTVATNTLLERTGAKVALVTTRGFRDVLEIGRQTRPDLYALVVEKPEPLVPRVRRFEVAERIGPEGEVVVPLDAEALDRVMRQIEATESEAVAIVFLFSFANPVHEHQAAQRLGKLGLPVTVSHEVLPEFREVVRTSTAVADAYLAPKVGAYLRTLGERAARCGAGGMHILRSDGSILDAAAAAARPITTVLSGPAGGVVGAWTAAREAGFERIISFDMGGTSTDVSLCDGGARLSTETEVGGVPVGLSMVDVHTIGAGGGSIAWVDSGGALRVGPKSAGADPGPACYGVGDVPTVTDANLLLGRLDAGRFLGGAMTLDIERAKAALERLGGKLGGDAESAAKGILAVVNANMARALHRVSSHRGYDSVDFALVALGGAGGLHAAALAKALGMGKVIIPRLTGVLSAYGSAVAEPAVERSRTVMLRSAGPEQLLEAFEALENESLRALAEGAVDGAEPILSRFADLRYQGQSYEVRVRSERDDDAAGLRARFEAEYERLFGHVHADEPIEVVTVRVRTSLPSGLSGLGPAPLSVRGASSACLDERSVIFDEPCEAEIYDRDLLEPGMAFPGPALVVEAHATTLVPDGIWCRLDGFGHLILDLDA